MRCKIADVGHRQQSRKAIASNYSEIDRHSRRQTGRSKSNFPQEFLAKDGGNNSKVQRLNHH
jgi:hypothetical protein